MVFCGRYRGVKLINHKMKIWEKIIDKDETFVTIEI